MRKNYVLIHFYNKTIIKVNIQSSKTKKIRKRLHKNVNN